MLKQHWMAAVLCALVVLVSNPLRQAPVSYGEVAAPNLIATTGQFIQLDTLTGCPTSEITVAVTAKDFQASASGPMNIAVQRNGQSFTHWEPVEYGTALQNEDAETPGLIETRIDVWRLRILAPLSAGDIISFVVTWTTATGALTTSTSTEALQDGAAVPSTVADCVNTFLQALGAHKVDGSVRFSSADCGSTRTAESALRLCLQSCDPPVHFLNDYTVTTPAGLTVEINVRADNGATGRDSSASGSADVVIAIGGNAVAGSTSPGGTATATNSQPGGATVAIAGDGQTSTPSNLGSAGAGGAATAISASLSGQKGGASVAIAGHGGCGAASGAAGGAGDASTTGVKATAFAQGGDGGDPANDNNVAGGVGGSAKARRPGQMQPALGAGSTGSPVDPIPAGHHGGGARTSVGPASGSYGNGAAIPNS